MEPISSHNSSNKPPFRVFLAATVMIFFCSLSAADSIGFVPYYIDGTSPAGTSAPVQDSVALSNLPVLGESSTSTDPASSESANSATTLPTRIQIPAIDMDLTVQNPSTRDVDALDALLVNGPARYVDSAKLGTSGNLVIFAHSSHLPIVHNKMFQAFNNVPNLKAGDTITLTGQDGKEYLYRVSDVVKADASDTTIDLSTTQGTKLTLVTCDTLTGKSARFVLTADFVGVVNAQ